MPQSGFTGDAQLFTEYGQIPAVDLVNQKFKVWNGVDWSDTTLKSGGSQPTASVLLNNGIELNVSLNQEFLISGGFKTSKRGVKTQMMKRRPARLLKKVTV